MPIRRTEPSQEVYIFRYLQKMKKKVLILLSVLMLVACGSQQEQQVEKPRVIVTCDPELDDMNSLIRYMLYSTDFQTEGIIYASSGVHWKGDGKGTTQYKEGSEYARQGLGPQTEWRWDNTVRFIDEVVDAYANDYPNLKVHDADYPTPEYVRSIVEWGNVEFEGDYSKDTDGSDLIKQVLLDENPAPVFVQVWGGASTVCAALRSIEEQYKGTTEWETIYNKVCQKLVLCLSGDQDGTYKSYIVPNWPDAGTQQAKGGVIMGYGASNNQTEENRHFYEPTWMQENILSKGALGSIYRVWGDGKQLGSDSFDYFGLTEQYTVDELKAKGFTVWFPRIQPKGTFISEGDTFCYMNLIGNGLRAWQDQTWGGWLGRTKRGEQTDPSSVLGTQFGRFGTRDEVLPEFGGEIQEDMAARMVWATTPNYADANHYPVITGPLAIEAAPGEKVTIKAKVTDPDGDELTMQWRQWKVGTYEGDVMVDSPATAQTTFTVPVDAQSGQTIHLVLEAKDNGAHMMKRYLRTVVTVK